MGASPRFREALDAEEEHLDDVRRWIVGAIGDVAGTDMASELAPNAV